MSAEVLARAALQLVTDANVNYERGHIGEREMRFKREVGLWLNHQSLRAEQAEKFGDYDERRWQAPLTIARAYLGEPA